MPANECYPRRSGGTTPRVFVDVTSSLMVAGQQPVGISHVEGEIARRLLFSALNFIPVVFGNDGLLFALSPEQAALIFRSQSVVNSQDTRLRKQVGAPLAAEWGASAKGEKTLRKPWKIRSKLHHATLVFTAWMPDAVREDVRAILRHVGRLAMTIISLPVREDIRAILIHSRRIARTIIYRKLEPVAAPIPAQSIPPTLQMVVHPRAGDVLWTTGLHGNFVPLRTIGEMRSRSGLRVAAGCFRMISLQSSHPSTHTELLKSHAVAFLDACDLVLTISEQTRRELLALAVRSGRKPPAIRVLRTGGGVRPLLDLDKEQSARPTVAQAVIQPNLETALADSPLWDEVAGAVKERLQMLVAESDAG